MRHHRPYLPPKALSFRSAFFASCFSSYVFSKRLAYSLLRSCFSLRKLIFRIALSYQTFRCLSNFITTVAGILSSKTMICLTPVRRVVRTRLVMWSQSQLPSTMSLRLRIDLRSHPVESVVRRGVPQYRLTLSHSDRIRSTPTFSARFLRLVQPTAFRCPELPRQGWNPAAIVHCDKIIWWPYIWHQVV